MLRAVLLVLFAALVAAEPSTFHFVNVYPGDSVSMNLTTTSPSSSNVAIGNIGFGQTHQPLIFASGTLGEAIVTTTNSQKYVCTVPIENAPSLGPSVANIAACIGASVLTCSSLFPAGGYSNAVPSGTTIRVLHASLSHRSKTLNFQWTAGTFDPESIFNVTFGVCSSWVGTNLEDWNGNSTLSASASSHGVDSTVAELTTFYSQSGGVATFVLADDETGATQILPIWDGFTQSPVPPVSMRAKAVESIPAFIVPRRK